jgi:hypothetical protein
MISQPSASTFSGMNVLSQGLSAFGLFQSGQQQKAAANYNAQIAGQNATVARESGALTEYQQKKNLEAMVGTQAAQFAAGGVSVTSGSPIDVMTDTLSKGYLDIAINKYSTELAARGYESQAAMDKYEGNQAATEGTFKAGLSLLKAAADAEKPSKIQNSGLN